MSAAEVTKQADALWTLQCAYREKQETKEALARAQTAFNDASRRHLAAMRRCHELKIATDMR